MKKNLALKNAEKAGEAIQSIRILCAKLSQQADEFRRTREAIESEMRALTDASPGKDLLALLDRLQRIREYQNSMEVGSFCTTEMSRALDAAWQRTSF